MEPGGFGTINTSLDSTQDASLLQDISIMKKSRMGALDPLGPIKLPTVRGSKDSPFKGFLDISIVS